MSVISILYLLANRYNIKPIHNCYPLILLVFLNHKMMYLMLNSLLSFTTSFGNLFMYVTYL